MKAATEVFVTNGTEVKVQWFQSRLLEWGQDHFRAFPWRETEDPYRLLIAEVMLHRTQVRQVVPVYEQFLLRFPNVDALALASREAIAQVMEPLGLHWRISLVGAMAADLVKRFGGKVPVERHALLSLPGVSDYIASAVRCFAFGMTDPLIDTNTVRIAGRIFGLTVKASSRRNPRFREILAVLIDKKRPVAYNYALLDLAHAVCLSRKTPACGRCPFLPSCATGRDVLDTPPDA